MRNRRSIRIAVLVTAALLLAFAALPALAENKLSYSYVKRDNAVEIVGADGTLTGTVTPLAFVNVGTVGNVQPVAAVASKAFQGQKEMTEFVVSNVMTAIAADAFTGCAALTRFTVQAGNPRYKDVDGVLYSADGTVLFLYPAGRAETSVVVADGTTSIADSAFAGNAVLEEIVLPASLKKLGANVFSGCTALRTVAVPSGVTALGSGAFRNCAALESVTLPASLTAIGDSTFLNCAALTALTLPEKLNSIGESAFQGMTGLTRLHVPGTVKKIGKDAFKGDSIQFTVKKSSAAQRYMAKNKLNYTRISGDMLTASLTLTGDEMLVSGRSVRLTLSVLPQNASSDVTFQSSNEAAATVDKNGRVSATKAISEAVKVTITATAADGTGVSASHLMTILPQAVTVSIARDGVDVTGQTLRPVRGEPITLTAGVWPEGASQVIKWTTSNKNVATVTQDGVVRTHRRGTVTISARAQDGSKVLANVKLSVQNAPAATVAPVEPEVTPVVEVPVAPSGDSPSGVTPVDTPAAAK